MVFRTGRGPVQSTPNLSPRPSHTGQQAKIRWRWSEANNTGDSAFPQRHMQVMKLGTNLTREDAHSHPPIWSPAWKTCRWCAYVVPSAMRGAPNRVPPCHTKTVEGLVIVAFLPSESFLFFRITANLLRSSPLCREQLSLNRFLFPPPNGAGRDSAPASVHVGRLAFLPDFNPLSEPTCSSGLDDPWLPVSALQWLNPLGRASFDEISVQLEHI